MANDVMILLALLLMGFLNWRTAFNAYRMAKLQDEVIKAMKVEVDAHRELNEALTRQNESQQVLLDAYRMRYENDSPFFAGRKE